MGWCTTPVPGGGKEGEWGKVNSGHVLLYGLKPVPGAGFQFPGAGEWSMVNGFARRSPVKAMHNTVRGFGC